MSRIEYTPMEYKYHASAPAWPQKILYYLQEFAEGRMNGWEERSDANVKFGNSWCLNFMIGLQLIRKGDEFDYRENLNDDAVKAWKPILTREGLKIYNSYKHIHIEDVGSSDTADILTFRDMLYKNKSIVIDTLFEHVSRLKIYKDFIEYLNQFGYIQKQNEFRVNYLNYAASLYNTTAKPSTASNRVPSILQLCEFLGLCSTVGNNYYIFDRKKLCNVICENLNYNTNILEDRPRNKVFFGAPGTGKSYKLNKDKNELLENGGEYERVTFHPDYTYAQFVGAYKPEPYELDNGEKKISYEYIPGPFIRLLVSALKNARSDTPKPYLLLIEEINRADVAAVFGDVFQLLDRDKNGVSQYEIQTSEDLRRYLAKKLNVSEEDVTQIKIPSNMFIWATMNSADQGVFPMDTAFKRRWNFEYIDIDNSEEKIQGKTFKTKNNEEINWNCLRKAINDVMSKNRINEDKLMGTFFIAKDVIDDTSENANKNFVDVFCNKVIMYLFEDAARQKQDKIFFKEANTVLRYSKLCLRFRNEGLAIFTDAVNDAYKDYKKKYDEKVKAAGTQVQE